MKKNLNTIIAFSYDDAFKSEITLNQVLLAKEQIILLPKKRSELLQVLLSLNLINAALKMKEFKSKEKNAIIHYGMLKPKVSRLFNHILENDISNFECNFYINTSENCAYIEIDGLQFSFHNITITENLQVFIDSERNKPQPWQGVRLQNIAGELFEHYQQKKEA